MPFDGTNYEVHEALVGIARVRNLMLFEQGWTKGRVYQQGKGTMCLMGAAGIAQTGSAYSYLVESDGSLLLRTMEAEAQARSFDTVEAFNDFWKTRHADVLDFIDAVENRLKGMLVSG